MKRKTTRIAAATLALTVGLGGCATNPYVFSDKLSQPAVKNPDPKVALVGELDHALASLMDQRQQLWKAAGDTETMKNLTALGLIGLGATALYKGLDATAHQTFLKKAGLGAAAVYAGATWLEPSARQRVYLAGAESLTCLALQAAPYEMTRDEFKKERDAIVLARAALETVYAQLASMPQAPKHSSQARSISRTWGMVRWAGHQLDDADAFLGGLERIGPHLREMTALTASETANQVERVNKDLSELPAAIAQLKTQANALLGQTIFAPATGAADAPGGADGAPKAADAADPAAESCTAVVEPKADSKEQAAKDAADEAAKAKAVADATKDKTTPAAKAAKADAATKQARADQLKTDLAARQAEDDRLAAAVQQRLPALQASLEALANALGKPSSLNKRLKAALERPALPKACGVAAVRILPAQRSLLLAAGDSFQFVVEGDTGRPSVQWLAEVPQAGVIDVSMPVMQDNAAVRFSAAASVPKTITALARITDSKRTTSVDVTVKVCATK